ncbi:restriction endonuclease [Glycomyces sp. TRM65418]|uniref:restriction endonuclease n=1 Tax=Glycomyces sp. TRM65418 TaxID=2867006 RepID=UPI001CE4E7EF|nr:restriction endonuclease [Glycomyces sp. TRM65418]MCC3762633.1 restriction endonuclease [Glycomyces sp. TRM65418]QZD56671.1 restriction endonuclease [Glycomyces sp. TRM65418]
MEEQDTIPKVPQLLWPTLLAVRSLGGSGSVKEIQAEVARIEQFTDEQLAEMHNDGPRTRLEYRGAWTLSHLKIMGLLDNSSRRGTWELVGRGGEITEAEIPHLYKLKLREQRQRNRSRREETKSEHVEELAEAVAEDGVDDWRAELLTELMTMDPTGFERLSERLLRRAGFVNTAVLGRTGDGGIDGQGVYRVSLVSFPVYFQCKRYKGSVGAPAVRDFRGAMVGRGDKGLLITTGRFTTDALTEATRDGAPPIDLIDGEQLCDLLKDYGLGVTTTLRTVEDITIDADFLRRI